MLVGDAQLEAEQTIASLGSPRILVGLSSDSFLGVAWPSKRTEPARARMTFWAVADVEVRRR